MILIGREIETVGKEKHYRFLFETPLGIPTAENRHKPFTRWKENIGKQRIITSYDIVYTLKGFLAKVDELQKGKHNPKSSTFEGYEFNSNMFGTFDGDGY